MSIYSTLCDVTNYILDSGYNHVFISADSENLQLYMPENDYDNIYIVLKRIDNSANTVRLNKNTTDNIQIQGLDYIDMAINDVVRIISFDGQWLLL